MMWSGTASEADRSAGQDANFSGPLTSRGVAEYDDRLLSPYEYNETDEERLTRWQQYFDNGPLMRCLDTEDDQKLLADLLYEQLLSEVKQKSPAKGDKNYKGVVQTRAFWEHVRMQLRMDDSGDSGDSGDSDNSEDADNDNEERTPRAFWKDAQRQLRMDDSDNDDDDEKEEEDEEDEEEDEEDEEEERVTKRTKDNFKIHQHTHPNLDDDITSPWSEFQKPFKDGEPQGLGIYIPR